MLARPRPIALACALLLLPALSSAQNRGEPLATLGPATTPEGSPWQFSVGVKAWANQWESWFIDRVQIGSDIVEVIETSSSPIAVAFIPFFSVRRGDLSLTFSRMTDTRYTLKNSLTAIDGTRNETDLNLAWRVLPTVNLTAGYKQLVQQAGGRYTWRGPVFGASAQAPLTPGWALYGTIGAGLMQLRPPESASQNKLDASYAIHELGVAYAMQSAWMPASSAVTLAVGYRSQTVRTTNYQLRSNPAPDVGVSTVYGKDDLRDTTQGLTLSLVGTF